MSERKSLLVGSIPAADTAEAVEWAFEDLGESLLAIPDGETGERNSWVASIIDRLSDNPAFELTRAGRWTTYDDIPRYHVRRGKRIDPATLELGYQSAYRQGRQAVRAAAAGQVQGRGVRRRRVILRCDGSGGQCRGGVLLFGRGVVDGA